MNRTKLVFVNNGIKVNSIPTHFPIQLYKLSGTPVVKGGQPCYKETEWPFTIIYKRKLRCEGPSQAADIETT